MSTPFVLETLFLKRLGRFEMFCRTHAEEFGLTPADMPMQGLTHIMERGGTLVLPNQVLQELMADTSRPRGMQLNEKGNATLPYREFCEAVEGCHNSSRPFLNYFIDEWQKLFTEQKVRYFKSLDDFRRTRHGEECGRIDLSNRIAIVADLPLHEAGAAEPEFTSEEQMARVRHEIAGIGDLLMPVHSAKHAPCCLLTHRQTVAHEFLEEGKIYGNEMQLNVSGLMSFMRMTGAPPERLDKLEQAMHAYEERYPDKKLGAPKSTGFNMKLLGFVQAAQMGATVTVQDVQKMPYVARPGASEHNRPSDKPGLF